MKIKLVVIVLFVVQIGFSQEFKGGLLGSVVLSQIDGDNSSGYKKFGFSIGAYTRFLFSEKWNLAVELKYIQKGSLHTSKEDPYSYFKVQLDYIEVPILLNYQLNENIVFGAGFAYGQLINARVEDSGGIVHEVQTDYNNIDLNMMGQVKYLFNEHLGIDLRMAYSLLYITNHSPYQFNNLLSLGIVYEI